MIFYPTGGGTGLIGMWKAFAELEAIGCIGAKRPRMVAVQAAGCAPMVRACEAGVEHAERWENAHTIASGIRVPQAVGDFLILRAVRESERLRHRGRRRRHQRGARRGRARGRAADVPGGRRHLRRLQAGPRRRPHRKPTERAVLFNCATGLKYPLPAVHRTLDRHQPIDFAAL